MEKADGICYTIEKELYRKVYMKELRIQPNDAGRRLDAFLQKAFPNLPQALMYKYIRKKRIKVNGKRAEISLRLSAGDTISLYIADALMEKPQYTYDFLHAGKALSIVYEDENLLLLDKKPGVLCHPDDREYTDTLISRVKRYLYEKGEFDPSAENAFTPALVNRIDRNTGGIVIAAKNAQALRILNQKMKDRELHKYYLCILHGTPRQKSGTLEGFLRKDAKHNKVEVLKVPCADGKQIRTKYRVLAEKNGLALTEVELLTGRTHQIRAHFAAIGHPLLGDGKYGSNAQNKPYGYKKQCLYSYKLTFDFQTDAAELSYLDKKSFEISDVWFRKAFFDGTL